MIIALAVVGLLAGIIVALGYAFLTTPQASVYSTTFGLRLPIWVGYSLWPVAVLAWIVYGAQLMAGSKKPWGREWAWGLTAAATAAWAGGAATGAALVATKVQPMYTQAEAAMLLAADAQKKAKQTEGQGE